MARRFTRTALVILLAIIVAVVALEASLSIAARFATTRDVDEEGRFGIAAIVVYGDSTPYGLGNTIRFSDEIARHTGAVVANRSRPGLNSTQVARIVSDDLAGHTPAIVVVMAGVNDGWNLEDVPSALLGSSARWYHDLPRLRTLRLFTIGIEAGLSRRELDSAASRGWSRRDETARLLSNDSVGRIQSASYRSIVDAALPRGVKVLFMGYQAEGYNHVGDLAEDVLRTEHGDLLLRLRDLFWQGGERRMIQPDQFHPTDEGQRAIGARVSDELRSRGWLPNGRSVPQPDGLP